MMELLRVACRILLRDYAKDVSGLYYDISDDAGSVVKHGVLNRKELAKFARTGLLPTAK